MRHRINNYLEKHYKILMALGILNAIAIFIISSISFDNTGISAEKFSLLPFIYHFFAFFFLSFFILSGLRQKPEIRRRFFVLLFILIIYAISDEIHQLFTPGRFATATDVIINFFGIGVGSGVYWWIRNN